MRRPVFSIFGCASSAATTLAAFLSILLLSVTASEVARAQTFQVLYSFIQGSNGTNPSSLVRDAEGNFYGSAGYGRK